MPLIILKYVGTVLAVLFLANGVYGIMSGKVYGRSWTHYWGGWCEKEKEPYYYWSYVVMSFFVAIVLIFSCASVFWI